VATLFDPGYQGQLLSPAEMITVTGWLIEQAYNMQVQPSSPSTDNMSATAALNTDQPPGK